jgi:hypothetical protein
MRPDRRSNRTAQARGARGPRRAARRRLARAARARCLGRPTGDARGCGPGPPGARGARDDLHPARAASVLQAGPTAGRVHRRAGQARRPGSPGLVRPDPAGDRGGAPGRRPSRGSRPSHSPRVDRADSQDAAHERDARWSSSAPTRNRASDRARPGAHRATAEQFEKRSERGSAPCPVRARCEIISPLQKRK